MQQKTPDAGRRRAFPVTAGCGVVDALLERDHHFLLRTAVVGSEATLTIDGPFNMPGGFEVRFPGGTRLRHDEPAGGHFEGLHYEAGAVARAIAAGDLQASQRTLAASIRTLEVADEIRRQLGVVFPGEAGAEPRPGSRRVTTHSGDTRRH